MPSGQRWVNVVHVEKIAGPPFLAADVNNVQPILVRLWRGAAYGAGQAWLDYCNTGLTIDDMTYTPLDGTSPSIVNTVALAGISAAISAPSEVAHVLTLRTLTRGRRYRGRIYFPAPIVTAYAAGGILVGTAVIAIGVQAAAMQTALIAAGYRMVVASYLGGFATLITSFTMDNKADVIRGRK